MRRWLAATLALALAAGAVYALVTLGDGHRDEIDEASRRRLLEVLRQEQSP